MPSTAAGTTSAPEPVPETTAAASAGPSAVASAAPSNPTSSAPDSGVVLELVAKDVRWDKTTLAAPRDALFKVHVVNLDPPAERHNLAIAVGSTPATAGPKLFLSVGFTTGERTYDIPALPAGTYLFWCAIHPDTMQGTLIVH